MNLVRRVQLKVHDALAKRNPETFAREIGVNMTGRVRFYAITRGMFGSEPWAITLGNNVHVTAGVQFVTHDGGTLVLRQFQPDLEWTAPISVGDDVYIGMNSIILPGVNIGNRVVIGAGSVVTKSVPSGSVVAGNPARFIKTFDDYYHGMREKSLGFGHLAAAEKDAALRAHYGYSLDYRPPEA